ncbi:hypothetical protein [uncultured Alsobacter sp.]|uniref:hypothetical protein n=1 Tax=uncultured Alsobacter sp. TaxID=1748258 RepID=UPI0025E9A4EA|nr:hypothetical protein [uncultured Alsobacter sp.]
MSVPGEREPFFIGWSRSVPPSLLRFCGAVALVLLALLAGLGLLLGRTVEDPAARLLAFAPAVEVRPEPWAADRSLKGIVTADPYPVLHLAPDAAMPFGRAVLLVGDGKRGADVAASTTPVEVSGGLLRRGDVAMLVLDGPPRPVAGEPAREAPAVQRLGRWRVAGEICDGKCYAGGMRPGSGLSHRACAELCLLGDVPAIFVAAMPVAGRQFLVLAAQDGGKPPPALLDLTALPVELEGEVERRGDMLIFKVDMRHARLL